MMKHQKCTEEVKVTKQSKLDKMCMSAVEDFAKDGIVIYDKNGNIHTGESLSNETREIFSSEKYKKWKEAHK